MASSLVRRTGLVAGLAAMGIVLVIVVLLMTPLGVRLAVGLVGPRIPMMVSVDNVAGRLIGPLRLRGVNLAGDGVTILVEDVYIDWHPSALLGGRVAIERIAVTGVRVVVDSAAHESEEDDRVPQALPDTTLIRLPVRVDFDSVTIDRIALVMPGRLMVDSGRIRLAGSAEGYHVEAHAVLSGPRVLPSRLALAGQGSLNGLSVDAFEARTGEGRARLTGSVAWRPFVDWDATFAGDSLSPGPLFSDPQEWPGSVTLAGSSRGRLVGGRPRGRLVVDTVLGTLRRNPLTGRLAADLAGPSLEVEALAFTWGSARVEAMGVWGDSVQGSFDLSVPEFATVHPKASGALRGHGEVSGVPGALRIQAEIDGTMLRWDSLRLDRVSGRITAHLDSLPGGDVDLLVAGLTADGIALDSLDLVGAGTSRAHDLRARVRGPRGEATLVAAGRWLDQVWSGRFDTLEIAGEETGRWRLTEPVPLMVSQDSARLDAFCLARAPSSLCSEGTWKRRRPWFARMRTHGLPLDLFSLFVPPTVSLAGTVAGHVALEGSGAVAASDLMHAVRQVIGRGKLENPEPRTRAELRWDADVSIDSVNPGVLGLDSTSWTGSLTMHAATSGRLTGGRLIGRLIVDTIVGQLGDAPLNGLAAIHIDSTALSVESLALTLGSSTLEASGGWADSINANWDLDLPSLEQLSPRLAGSVRSEGSIVGTPQAFAIDAVLDGHGLAWDSLQTDRFNGRVLVTVDSTVRGDVEADVVGVVSGRWSIDSLLVRGTGNTNDHRLEGRVHGPTGEALLELGGQWRDGDWLGTLEQLDIGVPDIGRWRLSNPAGFMLSSTAVRLDSLCLVSETSSFCADGMWTSGHRWSATSRIRALPLALFEVLLPEDMSLAGALDGDLTAESRGPGSTAGLLTLSTGPGEIAYLIRGQERRLQFAPASVQTSLGTEGLVIETALHVHEEDGTDFGFIEAHVELPRYRGPPEPLSAEPLEGTVEAQIFDASLIQVLDPDIASASGAISASLRLAGEINAPVAIGDIRYADGEIEFQDLGITVRNIDIVATGDRTGGLAVTGTMQSGPGSIAISGSSPVIPDREHPARLTIEGTRFQVLNTPEARVVVSPNLVVHIVKDSVDVTGEVVVPRAAIELTEVPAAATGPSRDVVFLDTESEERPITITSNVRIVLGDSVSFRGFGFQGQLSGSIEAIDRPPLATTASGEITIQRGRYRAYGQDLRIDEGRMIFNGPVDDPFLDVRAYREARDRTIAGLEIRGTLKEPDVSVFSNPPMPESQAMAYLVLGRPLQQGNASEQERVSQAATALGGDILAQSLGTSLGLEAGIEQGSNPNEASVVAGTYLSPRLFVAYGVGLFERVNIFRVRYEFTRRWSVQAESSRESSGDLFFNFERGP